VKRINSQLNPDQEAEDIVYEPIKAIEPATIADLLRLLLHLSTDGDLPVIA
jgi:hypothetical protein